MGNDESNTPPKVFTSAVANVENFSLKDDEPWGAVRSSIEGILADLEIAAGSISGWSSYIEDEEKNEEEKKK